jgi:Ca-activated chloride channel family protein
LRFADLPFLALIILIPIFFLYWKKKNRPAQVTFSLPIPTSVRAAHPYSILLYIKYLGLILAIVALARPQSSYRQTERKVSGIDIIMVMDVSASMNIEDLSERPRLDIAKQTIEDFIKGRNNDRIGFVIFSGEPLTLSPPTLDYGLVLKEVRGIETGTLKDGTAIGDGLSLAVNRLKDSKAKSRIIILLTDGDSNIGQVDPATAGDLAAGFGIKVYTIAIGREGRVRMPIRRKGMMGNTVTSYQWFDNALNTDLLQQIAKQSDGKFYRVQDESALTDVFTDINRLEKSEVKTNEKIRYDEIFTRPLQIALFLLVLEKLLSRIWWRVYP